MGQSINVLLYGARFPAGMDYERLDAMLEQWEEHVQPRIEAFQERLKARGKYPYRGPREAYIPDIPSPDDADRDELLGFYVCNGDPDDYSAHIFPAMTFAEMRADPKMSKILKRCRRRWSRFARWARAQGVELGKPRIWRTRTEVA